MSLFFRTGCPRTKLENHWRFLKNPWNSFWEIWWKMAKKDRESNFLPILHMKSSLILISIQLVGGGCRWCQVQPLAQVKSTSSCISRGPHLGSSGGDRQGQPVRSRVLPFSPRAPARSLSPQPHHYIHRHFKYQLSRGARPHAKESRLRTQIYL